MLKSYLNKPVAILLIFLAIGLWGGFSIFNLPMKMYPNVVKPGFRINFHHSDFSTPEGFYKAHGYNLEDQIKKIKGVEKLEAVYNSGWGQFKVDCDWGVDEEDIKQKMESQFTALTSSSQNKFGYNIRTSQEQGSGNMMIAIGDKQMSSGALREFLKMSLKPTIEKVDGVKSSHFWGWYDESPVIEIDRQRLLTSPVNLNDIVRVVKNGLSGETAGDIRPRENSKKIQVVLPPKVKNLDEVLDLVIYSDVKKNVTLRLKDIAKISRKVRGSTNLFLLDGHSARYMSVNFDPTEDIKRACDQVVNILENLKKEHKTLDFQVIVNPSTYIENALKNLVINAVLGGLIAAFIIFGFLKSIKSTVVVGISIPFCIIFAFILMQIFEVTVNIISLGGLAIGVGMIVDSSVVALENIYRKFSQVEVSRKNKLDLIIESSKEVTLPILSSILTSIVVFLPIIYTSSYTKAILGDLAKTVVFTLTGSIIAALIIVPIASFNFLDVSQSDEEKKSLFTRFFERINQLHEKTLRAILFSKSRCVLLMVSLFTIFLLTFFLFPKIKKEIIAVPSTNLFDISVSLQDNEDIALTKHYADKVAEYIKKLPEVRQFASYFWSPNFGFITAELHDRDDFKELKEKFNKSFVDNPEAQIKAQKWSPGTLPLPKKVDLSVDVMGGTQSQRSEFVDQISTYKSEVGASLRQHPWKSKNEGISIEYFSWVKRLKDVTSFVSASSEKGIYIDRYVEDGKTDSLYLSFQESQRAKSVVQLQRLPVRYNDKIVPLKALAHVKVRNESYTPIRRVDNKSIQSLDVNFYGKVSDKEKVEKVKKYKEIISKIQKPMELSILYPDINKELNNSLESFKFSLLLSLGLVFLIIALMFNSIKYPLIILMSVPLGMIGVFTGLWVTDSTISLNSMLGTILLSGLVVNNAILLIDFYVKEKNNDSLVKDRILAATRLRFRPVVMTTLTSLFGVLPIAIGIGESGEILQPLGISVFSGLLISTILTLYVVPSFIFLFDNKE